MINRKGAFKVKKIILIPAAIIIIIITGCSVTPDDVIVPTETNNDYNNMTDYRLDGLPSSDENENDDTSYSNAPLTIQDLFNPIEVTVFSQNMSFREAMPEYKIFYPFGEIMDYIVEGKANYVIFVEEGHQIEQQSNMLRISPIGDTQPDEIPVFMEITQVPEITVPEMENLIMTTLNLNQYTVILHLQPTESFPFVIIRFHDNQDLGAVTSKYIRDNAHGGVFVIKTQYSTTAGSHRHQFLNALRTMEIIPVSSLSFLICDDISENPYSDGSISIQNLFEPKWVMIFVEGTPELIRYYPFGEIMESGTSGIVSYVIFIENFYQAEQHGNRLLVTPNNTQADWSDIFMEIRQVPNISVEESEREIINAIDFNRYYDTSHMYPTEEFSFVRFIFYEGTEWNSIITNIYIRDNTQGGVFVITTQYTIEAKAIGNTGVRFRSFLSTLEVLDI